MIHVSLNKLLSKKENSSLVNEIVQSLDVSVVIQDAGRQVLFIYSATSPASKGNNAENGTYPINLNGELLGWVIGDKKASSVAHLVSYLANREFEKKTLVTETLDKYKELALLGNIADKIAVCLELKDITRLALDEARKLIKRAPSASIMLLKEDKLDIISAYGREYTRKTKLRHGEGIAGSVIVSGKAEIVNDVASDSRFIPGNNKIGSLMCVPLKVKDRVIGVFNVSNNLPVSFTSEELKLLGILSSQTASAIENAILHETKLREERIKSHLQRYVAPQIVKTIMDDKEGMPLMPAKRNVAILFSDIRNFSSTCEKLVPEMLVSHLNEYFAQMVEIIFDQNGTVNKFVGDMIVALFGAPSHGKANEKQAIHTAVKMQRRLKEMPSNWIRENFHTGIGISAGEVVVGNIGSPQHMDYTAIGDEVNVAERLQSMAKGGQILVGRNVYEAAKDAFEFKELGSAMVKGKKRSIEVFEVIYDAVNNINS